MRKERVRFLVIGAQAMRCHGLDRATFDLDLWLSPTAEDAKRLAVVFGKAYPSRSVEEWADLIHRPDFRMAYPDDNAKLADILTSINGADFEDIYSRRVVGKFGGMAVPVVSMGDLIELKRISLAANTAPRAKARDQADIDAMEAAKNPWGLPAGRERGRCLDTRPGSICHYAGIIRVTHEQIVKVNMVDQAQILVLMAELGAEDNALEPDIALAFLSEYRERLRPSMDQTDYEGLLYTGAVRIVITVGPTKRTELHPHARATGPLGGSILSCSKR
jgi:hypothetical protein